MGTVHKMSAKAQAEQEARAKTESLFSLLNSNSRAIGEIAEIRGEIGTETKEWLEKTGAHQKAIGFIAMLNRAKPEKRADILRTLDEYLPFAREEWAKHETPDMLDGTDADRPTDPEAGGDDLSEEMGAGTPPAAE